MGALLAPGAQAHAKEQFAAEGGELRPAAASHRRGLQRRMAAMSVCDPAFRCFREYRSDGSHARHGAETDCLLRQRGAGCVPEREVVGSLTIRLWCHIVDVAQYEHHQ